MQITACRDSLMAISLSLALVAHLRTADTPGQAFWPQ